MVMNTKYSSMYLGNTKTAVRKTPDDDIEQMGTVLSMELYNMYVS